MSVTDILAAACSADPAIRGPAEKMMNEARDADLPGFLLALMGEITDVSKPENARQMAATQLKNTVAFRAREVAQKDVLEERWKSLSANVRAEVKSRALAALGTPTKSVRYLVALVVANLARIEVPANEWPDLISTLCRACGVGVSEETMEAALTTLGYICEECDSCQPLSDAMQHDSNQILTAIFAGIQSQSPDVQYYAMNALCNSMDFVRPNMSRPAESAQIIQTVQAMCRNANQKTQAKALETLVNVALEYYDNLLPSIAEVWEITRSVVGSGVEEDAKLQALMVWMSVCKAESEMGEYAEGQPKRATHLIGQPLVDMLTTCLQLQEEGQTDEDWNVSTAASAVLVELAAAIGDPVVDAVMPFIYANIEQTDWRKVDAATVAFGCIIEGPNEHKIQDIVGRALPSLVGFATSDSTHPAVRDSALWTLGIIALEFSRLILAAPDTLRALINVAGPLLASQVALAERSCTIIYHLALHYDDDDDEEKQLPTNALSEYFKALIDALYGAQDRPDAGAGLRQRAQATINALIQAAAPDCAAVLTEAVERTLVKLQQTSELFRSGHGSAELEYYQSLACGSLTQVTRKMKKSVAPMASAIVNSVAALCSQSASADAILNEALMCIGALAKALEADFAPYLTTAQPIILAGLLQHDMESVSLAALGAFSDAVTTMGTVALPLMQAGVARLMEMVRDPTVERDLKPYFISCLGDIALHLGPDHFGQYVDVTFEAMKHFDQLSATIPVGPNEEDDDFVCQLYEQIVHCCTGVIQGFKGALEPVTPHFPWVLDFVLRNTERTAHNMETFTAFVGIIGDIANSVSLQPAIAAQAKGAVATPGIARILAAAKAVGDEDLTASAVWAEQQVAALLAM